MAVPNPVYLYRITHSKNLPFILQNGIYCPVSPDIDPDYINIGKRDIIGKREKKEIIHPPYGVLHDYVSFYFGPRSPMLYSIYKGYSDTKCTQQEIVYLVSSIPTIEAAGLDFIFTTGQALMELSRQYRRVADLDKIDWGIIFGKYWNDEPPVITDRKRKRQAEFLVHNYVPLSCILGLAVMNKKAEDIVNKMTANAGIILPVYIRPQIYY